MKTKRAISLLMSLIVTFCFFTKGQTGEVFAQTEDFENYVASGKTTVIACSDFQAETGNTEGASLLQGLLDSIANAGIESADGFLCCGDYDYEYSETKQGIDTIKETISSVVNENMVFVQGNHDSAIGTNGISPSGNNDPESDEYGVFVINEDDYMWHNDNENTIKRTAQNLIDYLNEKISIGYDKPIFVLSHLPLNYNMRTAYDGDGMHANYIFDALNQAGAKGLNIFFMFGHDHSNGWDDYLGGSAIYLKKGDNILIAQNSKTTFENKTLNFTYMNAGYVGYYECVNDGADDTLTMTSFEITDDEVSITRYDSDGVHNLKSKGVSNDYRYESGYEPNETVYESSQTVELTAVTDTQPIPDLIEPPKPPTPEVSTEDQYVRIISTEYLKDGGQYLLVYNDTEDYIMLPEVIRGERIGFNLESTSAFGGDVVKGDYSSKLWTFTKSGDDGWLIGDGEKYATLTNTTSYKITATLEDEGDVFTIGGNENEFTFTSGSYSLNYNSRGLINGYEEAPATFYIYEYVPGETIVSTEDQYIRVASADFLEDGGQYLLVYNDTEDYIMLPEVIRGERIGFNLESTSAFGGDVVKGDYSSKLWTFTKSGDDGWLIGDGEKYATLTNTTSYKITATLEDEGDVFTIGGNENEFTFTSGSYTLNYNSRGLINGYEEAPATFYIYQYFPGVKTTTQTSVTKIESGRNCEVVLNNVPVGSTLIVAGYKGTQLVCPKTITTTNKKTENVPFTVDIDIVKVFVFNSMASMIPLTAVAETIPVN